MRRTGRAADRRGGGGRCSAGGDRAGRRRGERGEEHCRVEPDGGDLGNARNGDRADAKNDDRTSVEDGDRRNEGNDDQRKEDRENQTDTADTDGNERADGRGEPAGAKTTRHAPAALPGGVGLFVDGPNVLREEFDVDLAAVRAAAADAGPLVATRLYLDEHASPGLIKAAEANGYRVVTTSGDVDVRMAVDATRFAAEGRAATLAVASRDTDFKPAVEAANEYGLATVVIAPGSHGRSDALRRAATRGVTLDE